MATEPTTINDLLARQALTRPNAIFAVSKENTYSYADIYSLSRRFASLLEKEGVKKGDRVAIFSNNSAAYLVLWFGANLAGAVAVTLNTELIGDGLRYSLRQCSAKLVVAENGWVEAKWHSLDVDLQALPLIRFTAEEDLFGTLYGLPGNEPVVVSPRDIATIVYTSGTTGLPKGVMSSHAEYLAVGRASAEVVDLTERDRIMLFLPLFHSNAQMLGIVPALSVGASLAFLRKFSATTFFEDAARTGATGFTFIGTVISILAVRHPDVQRNHDLRFCIGGGTPKQLWTKIEERFGFKIHELYGMTEVGGWVSGNSRRATRVGSCGAVRPDMEVRVFDDNDNEMPVGEAGEIVVRPKRPDVMLSGYFEAEKEMVRACRNFWFHTGDRGSFDSDGYLYFHGRMKELIRRSGEMVSPTEIETQLLQMPDVSDCAIVGVEDEILGEEIKAIVVTRQQIEPSLIAQFLKDRVASYMVPRYIEFMDVIPRTETEKILRRKLQYLNENVHDLKKGR